MGKSKMQRYDDAIRRNLATALAYNTVNSVGFIGNRHPRYYSKNDLGIRENDNRFDTEIAAINKIYTDNIVIRF